PVGRNGSGWPNWASCWGDRFGPTSSASSVCCSTCLPRLSVTCVSPEPALDRSRRCSGRRARKAAAGGFPLERRDSFMSKRFLSAALTGVRLPLAGLSTAAAQHPPDLPLNLRPDCTPFPIGSVVIKEDEKPVTEARPFDHITTSMATVFRH